MDVKQEHNNSENTSITLILFIRGILAMADLMLFRLLLMPVSQNAMSPGRLIGLLQNFRHNLTFDLIVTLTLGLGT